SRARVPDAVPVVVDVGSANLAVGQGTVRVDREYIAGPLVALRVDHDGDEVVRAEVRVAPQLRVMNRAGVILGIPERDVQAVRGGKHADHGALAGGPA